MINYLERQNASSYCEIIGLQEPAELNIDRALTEWETNGPNTFFLY